METAARLFPWRQLGALLADEGLLTETELELALDEQRRTGRLLGQIIVDRGYVSAFSLTRILAAQHGVEVQAPEEPAPEPKLAAVPATWRPLGRLLVEQGLITRTELAEALLAQAETDGRLGEILVQQGVLTPAQLTHALGEQHGIAVGGELEGTLKPLTATEPVYRVIEVIFQHGFEQRRSLNESPNFLDAADFAMEYVQEQRPDALEIERGDDKGQETIWTYSESRAHASELANRRLVDTFGFDPTRWDPRR